MIYTTIHVTEKGRNGQTKYREKQKDTVGDAIAIFAWEYLSANIFFLPFLDNWNFHLTKNDARRFIFFSKTKKNFFPQLLLLIFFLPSSASQRILHLK